MADKRHKNRIISGLYILVIIGILIFSAASVLNSKDSVSTSASKTAASIKQEAESALAPLTQTAIPLFSDALDGGVISPNAHWSQRASEILFRLLLAVLLSALIAFRPQRNIRLFQRNFHVAQTQILLSVVAAALMMIVGNNAARAFAIFAAVSLVRFRTNIRNPKEITVLLVSLAIGLAAGVGHWELGILLCVFVLCLLWFLEHNESDKSFRSMELTVKTQNPGKTQTILTKAFEEHNIESEMRRIKPVDDETKVGTITFYLNLHLKTSTDYLSEQILLTDQENIKDINWKHRRKEMHIYQ